MRRLVLLFLILPQVVPGVVLASPQEGLFAKTAGPVLIVSAADAAGFDFALVAGGTDGGNACAEGDAFCLEIDGHAEPSAKGYTYVDPNDDHSRIFFAETGQGLRIVSTIGDLGSGTQNRVQKPGLTGDYALVSAAGAASQAAPDTAAPVVDPATAQEMHFFRSPTGNIACLFTLSDPVEVRCDMMQLNRSFTSPPQECDLDWGDSFAIGETDTRGALVCHGDTVADPQAEVLDYGSTLSHFGITCTSARSGMTCQNNGGHGFSLARKQQKLF